MPVTYHKTSSQQRHDNLLRLSVMDKLAVMTTMVLMAQANTQAKG